ncbi:MAG: hypothetical protein WC694_02625 [Candidatus Paceibacterota bacterium]|jgi:hypothetical protein
MEKISTKNKTVKFISALLIISIITPTILFSIPRQVRAAVVPVGVPVNDYLTEAWTFKDWAKRIGEQLLKTIAKQLLAKMTQSTINWINSDFHGSPLFLENPTSFFNDIAKSELKNVVNTFGYDSLLYPFGKQFALNAINSYKSQLSNNMGYTLSKVMNGAQAESYRNNFNVGGWNGFLINTQYPQNNYIGSQMQMTDYLALQLRDTVQAPAQKYQSLLQQGMGFLSPQTCPSNPSYNNGTNEFNRPSFQNPVAFNPPTVTGGGLDSEGNNIPTDPAQQQAYDDYIHDYYANEAAAKATWALTNDCPGGLKNTTPGSVAANQVMSALNSPFLTTALDGAIGNSLSSIFDALLTHFLNKGLNALSGAISGTPSTVDNFSYDGVTLDGSTPTADDLIVPDNASVTVGATASTVISGGSGIYSIQPQPEASTAIAIASIDVSGSLQKLTIVGVTKGTTSIIVQDTSIPVKTKTVNITVNNIGDLISTPANISTTAGTGSQIITAISGGAEPYSIQTNSNEAVAIALLSGANLIVSGIADGATFVKIKDSSNPVKNVVVNITVGTTTPISQSENPTNHQYVPLALGQTEFNIRLYPGQAVYFVADTSAAKSFISMGMAQINQIANSNMIVTTDPNNIDQWYAELKNEYERLNVWGGNAAWPTNAPVAFANMENAGIGETVTFNTNNLKPKIWIMIKNESTFQSNFNIGLSGQ